jgi:hypothetical protein
LRRKKNKPKTKLDDFDEEENVNDEKIVVVTKL